jgi:hypothetical protein
MIFQKVILGLYWSSVIYYNENCNGVNKIDPKLSVGKKNFAAVFI